MTLHFMWLTELARLLFPWLHLPFPFFKNHFHIITIGGSSHKRARFHNICAHFTHNCFYSWKPPLSHSGFVTFIGYYLVFHSSWKFRTYYSHYRIVHPSFTWDVWPVVSCFYYLPIEDIMKNACKQTKYFSTKMIAFMKFYDYLFPLFV